MSNSPLNDFGASALGRAAQSTDSAIKSTQNAAHHAVDSLSNSVHGLQDDAVAATHRGVDALRDKSQRLRERASVVRDDTVNYIKVEPIKAMLMAAATGAAVMALLSMRSRSRHDH